MILKPQSMDREMKMFLLILLATQILSIVFESNKNLENEDFSFEIIDCPSDGKM